MELAEGSSLKSTQAQAQTLEHLLAKREGIDNYVAYVGTGSPRFYLPLDQQLPAANFAQFVVRAHDTHNRARTCAVAHRRGRAEFRRCNCAWTRLENGPPSVSGAVPRVGEHIDRVRAIAKQVEAKVRANPNVANVNLDWDEPSKVVRLEIDQDRARALGRDYGALSRFLSGSLSGLHVSTYREGNELIEMLLRGPTTNARAWTCLGSLAVPTSNGNTVSLLADRHAALRVRDGIIWHRDRLPTVTVRADIRNELTPPTVVAQILPTLDGNRAALPEGYLLETGGTVEDSGARAELHQRGLAAVPVRRGDAADAAVAQLLAHGAGVAHRAARADRRDLVPAGVPRAVRVRRDAGHDRAGRHDHAQLGDPGRPDRTGHRARPRSLARDHRSDGAALPADRADRARGGARDDPAVAVGVLRADGGGDHGRPDRGDGADAVVPAGVVRGVVQGEARRTAPRRAERSSAARARPRPTGET
jgi:multidrug efflux pump